MLPNSPNELIKIENPDTAVVSVDFNRDVAVEEAKMESARADMKQHTDKLIQGFEKLNDSHARRAIWELVQNACDLSDNCEIVIDFTNGFAFTHNGKPFSSKTLISLIKQVSSKSAENNNEIGQFGTGFITTHSFGKKINLNSILKEGEHHIAITDFLIDRQAKNSDELLGKLVEQEAEVFQLIRIGKILDSSLLETTFKYISDLDVEKNNILSAEANLHHYIPIVLALNPALKSVKVIPSTGSEIIYKKGDEGIEDGAIKIPILKNETPTSVYCLRSEDKSVQVILPLHERKHTVKANDSAAKLFLFFPLIGTEQWGCNFIIHSNKFAPTEPRDGIHIKSNNEQTREKEENNREIIKAASKMIFDFVEANAEMLIDPLNIAEINFDITSGTVFANDYYIELKKCWVDKFKTAALVETNLKRVSPISVNFIAQDLLNDDDYYDSIYNLVSLFWTNQIPCKGIAKQWTKTVMDWGDTSLSFITVKMLVEKIHEVSELDKFDENDLRNFYSYLLKHNLGEYFEEYKLLPNIKLKFVKRGGLKRPVNIDEQYFGILERVLPNVPEQFIKDDFRLGFEFANYTRSKLSDDFNIFILQSVKDLTPDGGKPLPTTIRDGLINLCCIFPTESTQSTRKQIMPKICAFYNLEFKEHIIPNVEEEKFDYDYTPFRAVIRAFLVDIIKKSKSDSGWVENEKNFLKDCYTIFLGFKDLKDIVESLPVLPNQNFVLCRQNELRKEVNFPEPSTDSDFLKDIYEKIVGPIRKELILTDFAEFLPEKNERTGLELSSKLEQEFKKHPIENIVTHPDKVVIFQVIQRITNKPSWAALFPIIDDRKALIMMSKISNASVKNDLFSIIGLDDPNKISLLGDLSKHPSLERIIHLGKLALIAEWQGEADFEFKKKIGVHIENLVRQKIESEMDILSVSVDEQQGGQDIVVKLKEVPVYYIEVKSRWDKNSSITMSNPQIKNAVKHKECYSLCCVEMTDYKPEDGNRHHVEDIEMVIDRIKFISDIGFKIEPLISKAISVENIDNEVKLTDDYRGVISQSVVSEHGKSLDYFVEHLVTFLSSKK